MKLWKIILLIALIMMMALAVGNCSCGDDDDDDSSSGDDDTVDDDDDDDDDDDATGVPCYEDKDGDGYGNPDSTQVFPEECDDGWVEDNTDCDDEHKDAHPDGIDLPDDEIDQDCLNGDFEASDENGIFVASSGNDANPGTMAEPKLTLQAGVDAANVKGKSVFVAGASYINGVSTLVSMYGGYSESFALRDPETYLTMITGPNKMSMQVVNGANAVINGFTVNGGQDATSSSCIWVSGSAILIKNIFKGSTTSGATTGVDIRGVSTIAKLMDNDILGGSATGESRGVIIVNEATATLENNRIDGGIGTSGAWGVKIQSGTVTLTDNEIFAGASDNCYGVQIEGGTATLTHNTIDGGTGSSTIGVHVPSGEATIEQNTISGGNKAKGAKEKAGESFGIRIYGGLAAIDRNYIDGGASDYTYGVSALYGQISLNANTISGGWAGYNSSGVLIGEATTLVNNFIHSGSANQTCRSASISITSALLVNNTLVTGYCSKTIGLDLGNASVIAVNNIIHPGSANTQSVGLSLSGSLLSLINNDIWSAGIDYILDSDGTLLTDINDVNGCTAWASNCGAAENNISSDPIFVDPALDDYHISPGACVDTGVDPTTWYSGDLAGQDFEGDPRPSGAGWDMGMDEYK